MKDKLLSEINAQNFPFPNDLINVCLGGSDLHGAKDGASDLDIFGVYVEPPENILGLKKYEHFCVNTNTNGQCNTADSADIRLYSLRNWASLIMKGDSTILSYLYTDNLLNNTLWETHIKSLREHLVSLKIARHYLGFATAQMERMKGIRGKGRHGQRLDLVEKYGYDTKFAMHYLRLLYECKELLISQTLTFPRPERADLVDVRRGKYYIEHIFDWGDGLMQECENLLKTAPLPENPDKEILSKTIAFVYREHWRLKCV